MKPARPQNTSGIPKLGVCATQTCATATLRGLQQEKRSCTHTLTQQVYSEEAAVENWTTISVIYCKVFQNWFSVSSFMPFLSVEATKTVMVVVLSSFCITIIAVSWRKLRKDKSILFLLIYLFCMEHQVFFCSCWLNALFMTILNVEWLFIISVFIFSQDGKPK